MWHICIYTNKASKVARLPGHRHLLVYMQLRERYDEKLELTNGKDLYEMPQEAQKDNADLWLGVPYINVGMYLFFLPSPCSGEDLMNCKALNATRALWLARRGNLNL